MNEEDKIREKIMDNLADSLTTKALKNPDLLEKIVAIAEALGISVKDVKNLMDEDKRTSTSGDC